MKLVLMKKGRAECERSIETEKLPPFYRLVTDSTIIGLHEETQLAPKHHGEYYALWGRSVATNRVYASVDVAVYVYIESEHVWVTEQWIGDVLLSVDIGPAPPSPFLRVFPGGAVSRRDALGERHDAAELYVLSKLELITPWDRKAIYKRAEVVYYQDPPAQPLKRLLDI